jgi:hypothetical protein
MPFHFPALRKQPSQIHPGLCLLPQRRGQRNGKFKCMTVLLLLSVNVIADSLCKTCSRTRGLCLDVNDDGVADDCHCPGKTKSSGDTGAERLQKGCDHGEGGCATPWHGASLLTPITRLTKKCIASAVWKVFCFRLIDADYIAGHACDAILFALWRKWV